MLRSGFSAINISLLDTSLRLFALFANRSEITSTSVLRDPHRSLGDHLQTDQVRFPDERSMLARVCLS